MASRGWRDPRFWCEACGKYSKQRYPVLVGALWGVTGGLIAVGIWFGPLHDFYFGEQTVLRLAAPLAGTLVALIAWPLFGRVFLRYRNDPQGHT